MSPQENQYLTPYFNDMSRLYENLNDAQRIQMIEENERKARNLLTQINYQENRANTDGLKAAMIAYFGFVILAALATGFIGAAAMFGTLFYISKAIKNADSVSDLKNILKETNDKIDALYGSMGKKGCEQSREEAENVGEELPGESKALKEALDKKIDQEAAKEPTKNEQVSAATQADLDDVKNLFTQAGSAVGRNQVGSTVSNRGNNLPELSGKLDRLSHLNFHSTPDDQIRAAQSYLRDLRARISVTEAKLRELNELQNELWQESENYSVQGQIKAQMLPLQNDLRKLREQVANVENQLSELQEAQGARNDSSEPSVRNRALEGYIEEEEGLGSADQSRNNFKVIEALADIRQEISECNTHLDSIDEKLMKEAQKNSLELTKQIGELQQVFDKAKSGLPETIQASVVNSLKLFTAIIIDGLEGKTIREILKNKGESQDFHTKVAENLHSKIPGIAINSNDIRIAANKPTGFIVSCTDELVKELQGMDIRAILIEAANAISKKKANAWEIPVEQLQGLNDQLAELKAQHQKDLDARNLVEFNKNNTQLVAQRIKQRELIAAEEEIANSKKANEILQILNHSLMVDNSLLQLQLGTKNNKLIELQAQVEQLPAEKATAAAELTKPEDALKSAKEPSFSTREESHEDEFNDLRSQLKAIQQKLEEQSNGNSELEAELVEMKAAKAALENQLKQLTENQKNTGILESEEQQLQVESENDKGSLEKLSKDIFQLREKMKEIKKLNEESNDLTQEEIEELNQKIQKLESELEARDSKIAALEDIDPNNPWEFMDEDELVADKDLEDSTKLKKDNTKLETEIEEFKEKLGKKDSYIKLLEGQNEILRSELGEAQRSDSDMATSLLEESHRINGEFQLRVKESEEQIKAREEQLAQRENQVAAKIKELEAELAAKNAEAQGKRDKPDEGLGGVSSAQDESAARITQLEEQSARQAAEIEQLISNRVADKEKLVSSKKTQENLEEKLVIEKRKLILEKAKHHLRNYTLLPESLKKEDKIISGIIERLSDHIEKVEKKKVEQEKVEQEKDESKIDIGENYRKLESYLKEQVPNFAKYEKLFKDSMESMKDSMESMQEQIDLKEGEIRILNEQKITMDEAQKLSADQIEALRSEIKGLEAESKKSLIKEGSLFLDILSRIPEEDRKTFLTENDDPVPLLDLFIGAKKLEDLKLLLEQLPAVNDLLDALSEGARKEVQREERRADINASATDNVKQRLDDEMEANKLLRSRIQELEELQQLQQQNADSSELNATLELIEEGIKKQIGKREELNNSQLSAEDKKKEIELLNKEIAALTYDKAQLLDQIREAEVINLEEREKLGELSEEIGNIEKELKEKQEELSAQDITRIGKVKEEITKLEQKKTALEAEFDDMFIQLKVLADQALQVPSANKNDNSANLEAQSESVVDHLKREKISNRRVSEQSQNRTNLKLTSTADALIKVGLLQNRNKDTATFRKASTNQSKYFKNIIKVIDGITNGVEDEEERVQDIIASIQLDSNEEEYELGKSINTIFGEILGEEIKEPISSEDYVQLISKLEEFRSEVSKSEKDEEIEDLIEYLGLKINTLQKIQEDLERNKIIRELENQLKQLETQLKESKEATNSKRTEVAVGGLMEDSKKVEEVMEKERIRQEEVRKVKLSEREPAKAKSIRATDLSSIGLSTYPVTAGFDIARNITQEKLQELQKDSISLRIMVLKEAVEKYDVEIVEYEEEKDSKEMIESLELSAKSFSTWKEVNETDLKKSEEIAVKKIKEICDSKLLLIKKLIDESKSNYEIQPAALKEKLAQSADVPDLAESADLLVKHILAEELRKNDETRWARIERSNLTQEKKDELRLPLEDEDGYKKTEELIENSNLTQKEKDELRQDLEIHAKSREKIIKESNLQQSGGFLSIDDALRKNSEGMEEKLKELTSSLKKCEKLGDFIKNYSNMNTEFEPVLKSIFDDKLNMLSIGLKKFASDNGFIAGDLYPFSNPLQLLEQLTQLQRDVKEQGYIITDRTFSSLTKLEDNIKKLITRHGEAKLKTIKPKNFDITEISKLISSELQTEKASDKLFSISKKITYLENTLDEYKSLDQAFIEEFPLEETIKLVLRGEISEQAASQRMRAYFIEKYYQEEISDIKEELNKLAEEKLISALDKEINDLYLTKFNVVDHKRQMDLLLEKYTIIIGEFNVVSVQEACANELERVNKLLSIEDKGREFEKLRNDFIQKYDLIIKEVKLGKKSAEKGTELLFKLMNNASSKVLEILSAYSGEKEVKENDHTQERIQAGSQNNQNIGEDTNIGSSAKTTLTVIQTTELINIFKQSMSNMNPGAEARSQLSRMLNIINKSIKVLEAQDTTAVRWRESNDLSTITTINKKSGEIEENKDEQKIAEFKTNLTNIQKAIKNLQKEEGFKPRECNSSIKGGQAKFTVLAGRGADDVMTVLKDENKVREFHKKVAIEFTKICNQEICSDDIEIKGDPLIDRSVFIKSTKEVEKLIPKDIQKIKDILIEVALDVNKGKVEPESTKPASKSTSARAALGLDSPNNVRE